MGANFQVGHAGSFYNYKNASEKITLTNKNVRNTLDIPTRKVKKIKSLL